MSGLVAEEDGLESSARPPKCGGNALASVYLGCPCRGIDSSWLPLLAPPVVVPPLVPAIAVAAMYKEDRRGRKVCVRERERERESEQPTWTLLSKKQSNGDAKTNRTFCKNGGEIRSR